MLRIQGNTFGFNKSGGFWIFSWPLVGLLSPFLCLCSPVRAQEQSSVSPGQIKPEASQKPVISALAKENLDRVAAAASDIEKILRSDPGLMVDTKDMAGSQYPRPVFEEVLFL
jgi:hypothetical protein